MASFISFNVLTFLQMKERHPHCRWHARNWVLVHITVMHLEAMRRSLKTRDPDLKVFEQYERLTAKGTIKKRKIRLEPESESESEVSLTTHTPINISHDCAASVDVHPVSSHPQAGHLEAKAGARPGEYAGLDC